MTSHHFAAGPAGLGPAGPGGEAAGPAGLGPAGPGGTPGRPAFTTPLRVSTLELFFDLVFAFTLTQLASLLAGHLSLASAAQALLIFGVLWWMYGGYAWLTNTRAPDRSPERLLLLAGMAGFLLVGLTIPAGFHAGATAVALGVGYLIVVVVHAVLYARANPNIIRVAPFNVCSALLVIAAGASGGWPAYLLWTAALLIQVLSPLIVRPGGLFEIASAHFVERHGALVIVALGESVAAIGIGAAAGPIRPSVLVAATLGLAVSAALWWTYFGNGDDERAERALAGAAPGERPQLALSAFFFAHIPMLAGIVVAAAGVMLTIGHAARPAPAGQSLALGGGVALFLAGHAGFRRALGTGRSRLRLGAAGFAVATAALGTLVAVEAQLAVLLTGLVAMLAADRRGHAR